MVGRAARAAGVTDAGARPSSLSLHNPLDAPPWASRGWPPGSRGRTPTRLWCRRRPSRAAALATRRPRARRGPPAPTAPPPRPPRLTACTSTWRPSCTRRCGRVRERQGVDWRRARRRSAAATNSRPYACSHQPGPLCYARLLPPRRPHGRRPPARRVRARAGRPRAPGQAADAATAAAAGGAEGGGGQARSERGARGAATRRAPALLARPHARLPVHGLRRGRPRVLRVREAGRRPLARPPARAVWRGRPGRGRGQTPRPPRRGPLGGSGGVGRHALPGWGGIRTCS